MALILATRNPHKLREFTRLLTVTELEPLPDAVVLPPETGATFLENALGKARAAAAQTGRAVIADDSGIAADALGGRPGVHSARYAGEHATDQENLDLLIAQAPPGSGLHYVCSLVYVDPEGGTERTFEGRCDGTRAELPRGERGFGYDPIFVPDDLDDGRTMAQLSDREKDAISHRGRALRAFEQWLGSGP
ncbi:MAG TPA: RdgB/HAM1 family non-canonical purine NTP pyrophosphatase [Solirubrobacteraceae bacterium]|nr:RdgB/HAM1 family non-canonical purine NTP pyrophosphatase [Solirubrobacteraceae bacterium]